MSDDPADDASEEWSRRWTLGFGIPPRPTKAKGRAGRPNRMLRLSEVGREAVVGRNRLDTWTVATQYGRAGSAKRQLRYGAAKLSVVT
jgi:hypothetical protein